jgi:hypothetical protein
VSSDFRAARSIPRSCYPGTLKIRRSDPYRLKGERKKKARHERMNIANNGGYYCIVCAISGIREIRLQVLNRCQAPRDNRGVEGFPCFGRMTNVDPLHPSRFTLTSGRRCIDMRINLLPLPELSKDGNGKGARKLRLQRRCTEQTNTPEQVGRPTGRRYADRQAGRQAGRADLTNTYCTGHIQYTHPHVHTDIHTYIHTYVETHKEDATG